MRRIGRDRGRGIERGNHKNTTGRGRERQIQWGRERETDRGA